MQQEKGRRTYKSASFLLFVLVPLLSLVAIQPILMGILPWRGDGLLHLVRLAELERAVRAGVLFPRWSPGLGYGFGFPLFHYYAPFSYYVALVPRLLGFSLPVSMAVSYVLALWMLGWGVGLWAKDLWRDWLGVITAVLATLYTPYILYNVYHRAALAELWGLTWLVMVLWAVNKVFRDWRLETRDSSSAKLRPLVSSLIIIAVFYALLILSHNINAMIGTALIVGYALFLIFGRRPFILHPSAFILLGLLLGLGLSAFFWSPAFFERNLVQIENLTATSGFSYVNHFLRFADVFAGPQTADPMQANPAIPRSLSWPVVVLALLAWLPMKRMERRDWRLEIVKGQRFGLTLAAILCVFMMLLWSQPLWQVVDLLAFVQFPWRFLGPATIFLAMLAGLGAIQLYSWLTSQFSIHYSLFIILVTSFIVLFALPWLFPNRAQTLPGNISPGDTIQFEVETGWLGTTAAADYLPRSVRTLPVPDNGRSGLAGTILPEALAVQDLQADFAGMQFSYTSDETVTAVFHQFLFPGWQAILDGAPMTLVASEPEGLITAVLPAGEHSFELTFGNTPLRTTANLISAISLGIITVLVAYSVIHKPPSVQDSQFIIHDSLFVSSILVVFVIFGLKTLLLDHINSPFRAVQFDEQTLATTQGINFGNVVKLLDADWPQETIPADQSIDIMLIWQALPPITEEYSVSVQLVGENGRRVAQSDSFHPAGLPLPRWQAGEYGLDEHRLTVLPATPPGDYELVVFVYNIDTGQRLDILNEGGLPVGNFYSLGNITLTHPIEFPNPDELAIEQREMEDGQLSPFMAENVQLLGFDQPIKTSLLGDFVPLSVYWHTVETPTENYEAIISIVCEKQGVVVPSYGEKIPAPDTTWKPGQIERVDFDVHIPLLTAHGEPMQSDICTIYLWLDEVVPLGKMAFVAPERSFDLPETAVPLNQSLANLVTLVGYSLEQSSFPPGETIPLTLYWQPEALMDTNYKVFVQLLDGSSVVTQQDQIPTNGARPTTGWVPGEFVQDDYMLVLPPDVVPGSYQLITGLYDAETGQRLTLADGSGDAITLPVSIEVKTAE